MGDTDGAVYADNAVPECEAVEEVLRALKRVVTNTGYALEGIGSAFDRAGPLRHYHRWDNNTNRLTHKFPGNWRKLFG